LADDEPLYVCNFGGEIIALTDVQERRVEGGYLLR